MKLLSSKRYFSMALLVIGQGCAISEFEEHNDSVARAEQMLTILVKGSSTTLDVGSWNLEWFGDTSNGPTNETLQLSNVRSVIAVADMDMWGVAEVVSTTQWNSLKFQLSGYSGSLANDASVTSGASHYISTEKIGILYKSSLVTVQDARIILTCRSSTTSGYVTRYPTATSDFASGTTFAAGKAVVVFAGASAIPSGLSNAIAASLESLHLSNSGDTVTLKDSSAVTVDAFTYSSTLAATDGVSMNLSPDGSTTGSFAKHTTLSSLGTSPGKRVSGSDW
jgi:hypothetical protein